MPATRGNRVNVFFDGEMDEDSDYASSKKNVNYPPMDLPLDDGDDVIDITCGVLQAKLHRQRFICPGINRDCIEYDGRLLTPKTFYILADKGSLKDWKNAIRINGKKIRRYIESGVLDFYNHKELCTGRCKSRLGNKISTLPMDNIGSLVGGGSPVNMVNKEPQTNNADSGFNSSNESIVTDSFGEPKDIKPTVEQLNMIMIQTTSSMENGLMVPGGPKDVKSVHPVGLVSLQPLETIGQEDEDQMFWRAIVQLGLIDEFFREIKSKLDILKVNMIKNFVSMPDAKKASSIVDKLGMKAKLDLRLSAHKFEFDRQRDKLEKEMEQLKKKVSEYEQKQEILKRKSDCYNHLMSKKKTDDISQNSFTFETSSGTSMVLNAKERSDMDDISRSSSPLTVNAAEISLLQKQRDMFLTKKRKGDAGVDIPTKYTIETPHGSKTVLVSQDIESTLNRSISPSVTASQDSSEVSPSPCPTTSQDDLALSPSQDSSTATFGDLLSQDTNSTG